MATIEQLAALTPTYPVTAGLLARLWWPGADWLDIRTCRHNGGPRKGARVAAGMAGRMVRKGLLMSRIDDYSTVYWRQGAGIFV